MRISFRPLGLLLLVALIAGAAWMLWQPGGRMDAAGAERGAGAAPSAAGAGSTAEGAAADLSRAAAAAPAGPAAPPPAAPRAGLTVRVTDENGLPIADALVRCGEPAQGNYGTNSDRDWQDPRLPVHQEVRTDHEGVARLSLLPEAAEVLLAAEAPGHIRAQELLRTPGANENADVGTWILSPAAPITLTFVDQQDRPAADLEFTLHVSWIKDDRRDDELEGRTDEAGIAIIEHAAPGMAGLWLNGQGRYATGYLEQVLQPGQREARIVLDTGLTVSGRILEADGTPVVGAILGLHYWNDEDAQEGQLASPWSMSHVDFEYFERGVASGADGSFACQGLPREQRIFALTAFIAPNQYYASRWTSRMEDVDFRIPTRHALRGKIRGPFDPRQATVLAEEAWERRQKGEQPVEPEFESYVRDDNLPCGAGGEFELLLPAGHWNLTVVYPGGAEEVEKKLSLKKDRDLGTIEVGGGASLRVVWPGTEWPAEPSVTLERQEMVAAGWFSDDDEEELDWNSVRHVVAAPDGAGAWLFRGLTAGTYRVILDAMGWEPAAAELELGKSGLQEIELTPPRAGGLIVTVTDAAGAPCTGRTITVQAEVADPMTPREELLNTVSWQYPLAELELGADGRARTRDLPAGHYLVYLGHESGVESSWSSDQGTEVGRVDVLPGVTASLDVSLAQLGQVQFLVRADDRPAPGVRIAYWLLPEGRTLGWGAFSDPRSGGETAPDGSYLAPGLAPGRYLVGARTEPRSAWSLRELMVTAGMQSCTVELASGALRGRVVDQDGAPVEAWIELCAEDLGRYSLEADDVPAKMGLDMWGSACGLVSRPSLPDGSFQFRRVSPGRYRLKASQPDQSVAWSGWIEVRDGAESDAGDLRLLLSTEVELIVRGCAPWEAYWAELVFRPAEGGEIWQKESLYIFNDKNEDTIRVELPLGRWAVEMEDLDGTNLGRIAEIHLTASGSPPAIVLPAPASVGAKVRDY